MSSSRNTLERIDAHGVLLIGDPHASFRRPGRRCDEDFVETVIGKLAQAIAIANEEHLVPLFFSAITPSRSSAVRPIRHCPTTTR